MPDCLQQELMLDVAAFRILTSQKLAARRKIVKQGPDLNLGSGGLAGSTHRFYLATVNYDLGPFHAVVRPSGHSKPGNAGNARQRFPSKPERVNLRKIEPGPDLARRMSFEAQ